MKRIALILATLLLWAGTSLAVSREFVTALQGSKRPQTITWGTTPTAMTVGDADQTLTGDATSTSGLAITYTDTVSATYCTIVSGKLHAVAAGTCYVHADQAGDGHWFAAAQATSGAVTISGSDPCACGSKTYVGFTTAGANDQNDAGYAFVDIGASGGINVAGSGTYTVCELSSSVHGTGNIRMAVYDANPNTTTANLVCQGSGGVAVSGTSYTWQGHLTSSTVRNAAGNGDCVLTKGTTYYLGVSLDNNSTIISYGSGNDYASKGSVTYVANGWPATISSYSKTVGYSYDIRAGYCP